MSDSIVISCFDLTGTMVRPWADAGYRCYCVDIQHPKGETRQGNIIKVGADMRDWLPPREPIRFASFFPPCTDVAVSGARWFRDKGLFSLNCSTPPSVSRNGLERPTLLKTPSPRSRRIGESQTTPLIRAITRDIPAGKRISTPRRPAFGLAGDSRCLNPENGLPFRGVKCTCFPHPGSGPICAALRQRALPAPSLRPIHPRGACHELPGNTLVRAAVATRTLKPARRLLFAFCPLPAVSLRTGSGSRHAGIWPLADLVGY